jgi:DNA polymerase III subunit delta'
MIRFTVLPLAPWQRVALTFHSAVHPLSPGFRRSPAVADDRRHEIGCGVMSAPEPRANPILLGHEGAERMLLDAMHLGRMHHAWLITGPEGIGKATLAFRFARRLLVGHTAAHENHASGRGRSDEAGDTLALDPAHPVFRRVIAGGHADMLTIERAYDEKTKRLKRDIAVRDVREINSFMALTPAEGGWRVAVVDGAEDLNQSSANALLKILEEPPSRAVLILVCSAPGRLLPTIRSRCRHLRLAPLPDDVMARLMAAYLPERSQDDRDRLVTLAEGSIGRALAMAEDDGIAVAALVDSLLASLPDLPLSRGYEVADALSRGEAGFRLFTDQLITGVAALVRDTVRGRADPEQQRLAALRPLEAWGEVWQGLLKLQDETERFALDKRQALVSCVSMLAGRMS